MTGVILYRLVAEMACLGGLAAAAILAYADKSPWVWAWFLLFAFCNILTGGSKQTITESKSEQTQKRAA